MMLEHYASNLVAWTEQVLVIATAGLLLPMILRIRHPRTQLVYCRALLALCLIAPAIQPWQHPAIATPPAPLASAGLPGATTSEHTLQIPGAPASTAEPSILSTSTKMSISRILLWILAAGAVGKLCWLAISLWRIRSYRIAATPLYPIPEPVRAASAITQADAVFCVSADAPGPVILGWLAPVVLLPECFLALGEEAQCGIACHELLHVRRHDWLITVFEEFAGAILWFNPAIWMLLSQIRLFREQLVDEEVVFLTGACDSYIEALLAIARGRPTLDLAPAPLFLRRRHLTQRMHSLLREVSMSRLRLTSSYASIAAVLLIAGWFSIASFPLVGSPQVQQAQVQPAQIPQATPPRLALRISTDNPRVLVPPLMPSIPTRKIQEPVIMAFQPPQRIMNRNARPMSAVATAPVPSDPHELATAGVQVANTPADRLAAMNLMRRAAANAVTHRPDMPPFNFKVTYTSSGNLSYVGSGELTELWMSGQNWRVTETLGKYSLVRVGYAGQRGDEQAISLIPMRAHGLRSEAIWAAGLGAMDRFQIRTAASQWNGKPVTCVLISGVGGAAAQTQARLWEEEEYCIANESGLIQIHSIAPGAYAVFDYSKSLQFHGMTLPNRITVYMAGAQVSDGEFSITDAGNPDPSLLTVTLQMIANTRNFIALNGPMRMPLDIQGGSSSGAVEPVIVHAQVDGQGNVLEAEVSAAANPSRTQAALEAVKKMKLPPGLVQVYVNVRFLPAM